MSNAVVKLQEDVGNELFRASKRATEESTWIVDDEDQVVHWVKIPWGIYNRMEEAVVEAEKHAPDDWRP